MRKILQPQNSEKEKNAPDSARKRRTRVRFGCWRGWERLETDKNLVRKPGVRTNVNTKTMQHMKKENRRKPSVFAGFVAWAEGLSLACRLGRFATERHWRSLTPRHAVLETAALPTELYPYLKFCLFILSSPRGIVNRFFEKRCNVFAFLTVHPHML